MRSPIPGLLLTLFAVAASAADLTTGFSMSPASGAPGEVVRFGGSIVNDDVAGVVAAPHLRITFAPDIAVEAIDFYPVAPTHGWNCATSPGLVDCTHTDLQPKQQQWYELSLRMPFDRAGGRKTIVAEATSSSPDVNPRNNRAEGTIVVTRVIPVVFYNELAPAIEEANRFCTGDVPCSISVMLHPELLRDIHLAEPLPAVTACDLTIAVPRASVSFPPPTVTVHGDGLRSGNGLELRSACNGSTVRVEGLNFSRFPENGIAITGDTYARYTIRQSILYGNARGVAVTNLRADTNIESSTIVGNRASGVAVWAGARTSILSTSIGETQSGEPLPNGASGVFVSSIGGHLELASTTIANHPQFGVTLVRGATLALLPSANRITNNRNLDVDWNVDGPTPNDDEESDEIPNAPRIVSAVYDAASNKTLVTVNLDTRAGRLSHYFQVFLYSGTSRTMFGTAHMDRLVARKAAAVQRNDGEAIHAVVVFEVAGELRGSFLSAQTAVWPFPPDDWPDAPPTNMSELSAAVEAR